MVAGTKGAEVGVVRKDQILDIFLRLRSEKKRKVKNEASLFGVSTGMNDRFRERK